MYFLYLLLNNQLLGFLKSHKKSSQILMVKAQNTSILNSIYIRSVKKEYRVFNLQDSDLHHHQSYQAHCLPIRHVLKSIYDEV